MPKRKILTICLLKLLEMISLNSNTNFICLTLSRWMCLWRWDFFFFFLKPSVILQTSGNFSSKPKSYSFNRRYSILKKSLNRHTMCSNAIISWRYLPFTEVWIVQMLASEHFPWYVSYEHQWMTHSLDIFKLIAYT